MKIEDELKIIQARLDKIMAPTPEPKDKFGNTKAQKEKLAMDWITRPSTKPYRAALAKKDREENKPKGKPMELMTYIDRIERNFGDKK